ncbi:hypothetical protein ACLB1R_01345 [Escherichia coli]
MIQGQAVEAACQPARKPLAGWRLPEGKRATLARSPLPFPVCDVSGIFFLMFIFLWLPCLLLFFFFLFLFPFLSCLWLSRASPWRGGLS